MCGINGFVSNVSNCEAEKMLALMNDLIIHRGPDSSGIFVDKSFGTSIAMGMRRLSIIDLAGGNQPFFNEDKSIVIVFNGEIYNYNELKNELLQVGCEFRSSSDTEVILRMYEFYGSSAFSRLDGMFAFSIYDKNKGKIYIGRDFFGEKPLYYCKKENNFYWCSELKSLLSALDFNPTINKKALNQYFRLTYIPAPLTIYNDIYKLSSNSVLEYSLVNSDFKIYPLNKLNDDSPKQHVDSYSDAVNKTKKLVYDSVLSRSISDVPVGSFLSGGVDSSIVSLCLAKSSNQKISTFSIGFDNEDFDESYKAAKVANIIGSDHHSIILGKNSMTDLVGDVIKNFDEPFADSSALPTYMVSNLAKDNVKVVLTGDGGDEIFGGYNKYLFMPINKKYTKYVPECFHNKTYDFINKMFRSHSDKRGLMFKINKTLSSIDYGNSPYMNILSLGCDFRTINLLMNKSFLYEGDLFKQFNSNLNDLNYCRDIDRISSLEGDLLVKVDRVSMLNSLECRAPFLNKRLWDFSMSLPPDFLISKNQKKKILKDSFSDEFPKGFFDLPKKGFGVPVGEWLRTSLKDQLLFFTSSSILNEQGIFNTSFILKIVQEHLSSKTDHTFLLWTLFCFQYWYYSCFATNKK